MRRPNCFALASALTLSSHASAAPTAEKRDVDTRFPYNGPDVPIGDWIDQTINGNGKGFIRLVEAPAVKPAELKPRNSVNVISLAYIPNGMTVHFQTAFGLDGPPTVHYGEESDNLCNTATGYTTTYDRTPPCSEAMTTMCSQYFHNVLLRNLKAGTKYHYSIAASNGTTASQTLQFTTAPAAGGDEGFTVAVLNDMGYTNAKGTHQYLSEAADSVAFAWHGANIVARRILDSLLTSFAGGDISYADDWFDGILACEDDYVCYNGSNSRLSNTPPAPFPDDYNTPLPEGEIPNQGSPRGGDASSIYETNWDIWQQWMNSVSMKVPYMVGLTSLIHDRLGLIRSGFSGKSRSSLHGVRWRQQHYDGLHERGHQEWHCARVRLDVLQLPGISEVRRHIYYRPSRLMLTFDLQKLHSISTSLSDAGQRDRRRKQLLVLL